MSLSQPDLAVFRPVKVAEIELSLPIPDFNQLYQYDRLQVLVRLHGVPLGYLYMPLSQGSCSAAQLSKAVIDQFAWSITRHLSIDGLSTISEHGGLTIAELVQQAHPEDHHDYPLVTIAICTRDRTNQLKTCLKALSQLDYPHLELLIIDNAPSDDSTQCLVKDHYPQAHYVRELRPGLSWSRNRAIIEAKGEILAFTDDDVIVDRGWVKALVKTFNSGPDVMAVTGLVVPYELETASQILFERHGGFGKGFDRKIYRVDAEEPIPWYWIGTGQCGTGANMAFRRDVFQKIGVFHPAFGAGTVTQGCEDLEMFFRVLKGGYTLIYEPQVLVRHCHRRDYQRLRVQLASDGIGLYSYFVYGFLHYPQERWSFLFTALWWLWYGNLRILWITLKYPNRFPRDLIWAEIGGCFQGLTRYSQAIKIAQQIATNAAYPPLDLGQFKPHDAAIEPLQVEIKRPGAVAVRRLELNEPLQPLTDINEYNSVRLFLTWNNAPLGSIDVENWGQSLPVARLKEVIFDCLSLKLFEPDRQLKNPIVWAKIVSTLSQKWNLTLPRQDEALTLPDHVPVSVVVSTFDRPDSLRNCLRHLVQQTSSRPIEIIVVDNHPDSGLTPPVVAEFPAIKLVTEPRQGLAYGRNAGIVHSTGEIILATDDDVRVPPDWIESLVAPFTRPDVMAVTGNVLPSELTTKAQRLFELYGGLGRGFYRVEVNADWFEQFPRKAATTWELGATANAAFRTTIFSHPKIGLMNEVLGPGMPSGVGEDTYLFYKILKAGYTLVYEPRAYVWHHHRQTMVALRQQIYNYSKGHVAYNLTTWLQDGDWRGLVQIVAGLPLHHARQIYYRLRGWSQYPLWMTLLEILGNLAAPWSLYQSYLKVKQQGRSQPYIPVALRPLAQVSSGESTVPTDCANLTNVLTSGSAVSSNSKRIGQ